MTTQAATYEIDAQWKIVRASDAFCRAMRCTEPGLVGRDVRDLVREDWRADFRSHVTRALVGIGDAEVTVPLVAPCGQVGWFKHSLEALIENGALHGYRATVTPRLVHAQVTRRWWHWRASAAQQVWDVDSRPLANVG